MIPAGADVVWRFQISGAHAGAFLWMMGDQWSAVTIPAIDPFAPENEEPTADPHAVDATSAYGPDSDGLSCGRTHSYSISRR